MNAAIHIHPRAHDFFVKRPRIRMLPIAIGFAVALPVAFIATLIFLQTDAGRRTVANMIEHAVSDAIPGTLKIGRLESLGWFEPVVEDLRFLHPDGTLILLAKRAEIDLDPAAAFRGQFAFHRARIQGGYLLIAAQPDGRTGLEATFDDGVPSKPDEQDDYLPMQLRSIFVDDMTTVFRPSKDHTFRLRNVQGFVAVTHLDTPGARVRLDRISGEVETPNFLGEHLTLSHVDGWVHGKEVQVLDLDIEAQLGAGELDGHLAFYDRKQTPVELELDPKSGALPEMATLALETQSWFTDTIEVNVR